MRKVPISIYMDPEQHARLKALSERTHVPVSDFVRQGVELILAKLERDRNET